MIFTGRSNRNAWDNNDSDRPPKQPNQLNYDATLIALHVILKCWASTPVNQSNHHDPDEIEKEKTVVDPLLSLVVKSHIDILFVQVLVIGSQTRENVRQCFCAHAVAELLAKSGMTAGPKFKTIRLLSRLESVYLVLSTDKLCLICAPNVRLLKPFKFIKLNRRARRWKSFARFGDERALLTVCRICWRPIVVSPLRKSKLLNGGVSDDPSPIARWLFFELKVTDRRSIEVRWVEQLPFWALYAGRFLIDGWFTFPFIGKKGFNKYAFNQFNICDWAQRRFFGWPHANCVLSLC